ncbi:MAG TPA: acyl-CoA dehydrogenase family protein, partial [Noviherbaspirillum sp.]|nr:acyl-CoA dehydrogenase family protein [Noviherbaspirillum sp.]
MIRDPEGFASFLQELRRFVRERLVPQEKTVMEQNEVPQAIVDEMAGQGLFGYSIPEEYGGAGMTTEELVLAAIELSQCSVAFRARVGTNTGIGSEGLVADGTAEQKRKYLPRLASGEITGAFALTEPEAGSDATSLRSSARRDGDDYILNGVKCFIT